MGFSIMVHCVCIIHFIITFFFTGFVAHHYNENIGIILTVKGEIVIFEKSVVFKQEGYHDWCKIDQVQQLTVGSYVKLRKHPSNVAEKVWSCHDFGTLEPSRPASTNVKGDILNLLGVLFVIYLLHVNLYQSLSSFHQLTQKMTRNFLGIPQTNAGFVNVMFKSVIYNTFLLISKL